MFLRYLQKRCRHFYCQSIIGKTNRQSNKIFVNGMACSGMVIAVISSIDTLCKHHARCLWVIALYSSLYTAYALLVNIPITVVLFSSTLMMLFWLSVSKMTRFLTVSRYFIFIVIIARDFKWISTRVNTGAIFIVTNNANKSVFNQE